MEGRTVSVSFALAVVDGLRYNSVPVKFEPGWDRRGNGQSFPAAGPDGSLTHHTGANYDGGYSTLVRGRQDLSGPLCNSCGHGDGLVTIIAAFPANHAGAAGGSLARPYPDTRNFNRLVWGHEIMFPGLKPWTPAQYRSARVLAAVILGIRRRGPEWAKAHYETSVTGKWDPGVGNGRHEFFPFNTFRAQLWEALKEVPLPPPPPPPGDSGRLPTLKYGMRDNPSVASLQRFCNAHNWQPELPLLPATGNYLDQTKDVVRRAQIQMGVGGPDADGSIIGPRTNAALWQRGYRG